MRLTSADVECFGKTKDVCVAPHDSIGALLDENLDVLLLLLFDTSCDCSHSFAVVVEEISFSSSALLIIPSGFIGSKSTFNISSDDDDDFPSLSLLFLLKSLLRRRRFCGTSRESDPNG